MVVKGRRNTSKNPPVFTQEFLIQNHADVVACVAMVFVVGLMFQVSSPLASLFIALHHNVTVSVPNPTSPNTMMDAVYYMTGPRDAAAIFFYLLIAIVMHQIVQEYLLDKVNRRLHLSKVKHTKFNESGQLFSFYLVSIVWGTDIIIRENLASNIRSLWEGYPHIHMTFMFKFFFIVQIAYWLHIFPELYFQRVKREDMGPRIRYASLYLAFIVSAYFLSFTRLALCLIVVQYAAEATFHACRLLSYADKADVARPLANVHDALFVLARLGSIALAVLTFWYGLAQVPSEGFNTAFFRMLGLSSVSMLQAWLMFNFITFHLRRRRESASSSGGGNSNANKSKNKSMQEKAKARKERKVKEEESDLPEVDQDTRSTKKVK